MSTLGCFALPPAILVCKQGGKKKKEKKKEQSLTNLLLRLDLHSPALGTAARLLRPICSALNKLHNRFREVI